MSDDIDVRAYVLLATKPKLMQEFRNKSYEHYTGAEVEWRDWCSAVWEQHPELFKSHDRLSTGYTFTELGNDLLSRWHKFDMKAPWP